MTEQPLHPTCEAALAAFQTDPLDLPAEVEAHVRHCRACSEARIVLLSQEEAPLPLAPAGYFERLPGRILRKLPQKRQPITLRPWMLATAAALLLAVGGVSFFAGRANQAPSTVNQAEMLPPEVKSIHKSTLPFHDPQDDVGKLKDLSPEEVQALLDRLDDKDTTTRSE